MLLTVESLMAEFAGYGAVAIDAESMDSLEVENGDFVGIDPCERDGDDDRSGGSPVGEDGDGERPDTPADGDSADTHERSDCPRRDRRDSGRPGPGGATGPAHGGGGDDHENRPDGSPADGTDDGDDANTGPASVSDGSPREPRNDGNEGGADRHGDRSSEKSGVERSAQLAVGVEETGIVALDERTRRTLGVEVGDTVSVTPLPVAPAHRVEVSLADPDPTVDREEVRARLKHRILAPGDTVPVPVPDAAPDTVDVDVEETLPSHRVGTREYTTIEFADETPDLPLEERGGGHGPSGHDDGTADRVGTDDAEPTFADVGGLDEEVRHLRERVQRPLSDPDRFERVGLTPPTGVLLHGPPGTGKTLLARALASEIDAEFLTIGAGEVLSKWFGESESNLRSVFEEARESAPAVVYIDEIDAIAADRSRRRGPETRVVNELLTQMDGLDPTERVVVVASTNRIEALDPALRRPGRFDHELEVGRPDAAGREAILEIHTRDVPTAEDLDLSAVAARTNGWTGADLEGLVREATFAALRGESAADRSTNAGEGVDGGSHGGSGDDSAASRAAGDPVTDGDGSTDLAGGRTTAGPSVLTEQGSDREDGHGASDPVRPDVLSGGVTVRAGHFELALDRVDPTGTRSVAVRDPEATWEDVGGLKDVERTLREVVEWPYRYPDRYDAVDLDPATGVLLAGPPGTGKTLVAEALAAGADATFLPVRGPELLEGRVGATERRLRELFETARTHAPSIVFFDEFDALAGARPASGGPSGGGGTGTGAGSAGPGGHAGVVGQLLAELDGLAANDGVTVVAATNRPGAIDEAVLRAGRFDEHLHLGLPDRAAREEILAVHTRSRPLAEDVDLSAVAARTDGWSGAELATLCRLAARRAVRRTIEAGDDGTASVSDDAGRPGASADDRHARDRESTVGDDGRWGPDAEERSRPEAATDGVSRADPDWTAPRDSREDGHRRRPRIRVSDFEAAMERVDPERPGGTTDDTAGTTGFA